MLSGFILNNSFSRLFLFSGLLFFALPGRLQGQPAGGGAEQPAVSHPFDRPTWERAVQGLDYGTKDEAQPDEDRTEFRREDRNEQNRESRRPWFDGRWFSNRWLTLTARVLVVGGSALLLFALWQGLLNLRWRPRNRSIRPEEALSIDLERVEENPGAFDLNALIRQALAAECFDLAIRLYYLAVLQNLADRRLIRWKKNKTNRDYMCELAHSPLYGPFAGLTAAFERIWYGEHLLNRATFDILETRFQSFFKAVREEKADKVVDSPN